MAHPYIKPSFALVAFCAIGLLACGSDAGDEGDVPTLPSLFDQRLFTTTPTTEDCELDNGSSTQCYKISFRNYQRSTGPFCPATVNDIGGVGVYDGDTNPGFQVLKKTLWDAMEADGFDIVDDEGNVRFNLGKQAVVAWTWRFKI
jgi:hypothetical protein